MFPRILNIKRNNKYTRKNCVNGYPILVFVLYLHIFILQISIL